MRAWIFESVTCAWSWAHYVWGLVTVGLLPKRSNPCFLTWPRTDKHWCLRPDVSPTVCPISKPMICTRIWTPSVWCVPAVVPMTLKKERLYCHISLRKGVSCSTHSDSPKISVPHETRTYEDASTRYTEAAISYAEDMTSSESSSE